jgi:hypothetical protein
MIQTKREARIYYHIEREKTIGMRVIYSLIFNGKELTRVFNELGHSVEKESEVWDYFNQKYNVL